MLAVVYDAGVATSRITIERLVAVMAENPARVFGLWPRKGCIVEGADADLVLWDPLARRTLRAGDGHSRSGYTLYEGRNVRGDARMVIAGGRVRVREGALTDESPSGRFLPTGPFDMLAGR
jgi:dihydropyrimidinase